MHPFLPAMRLPLFAGLALAFAAHAKAADIPAKPIAAKGDLILSDDFERSDLGAWKPLIPTFTVEGGALKGVQTRSDHGAVGRFYHPMKDVVVEFKFQLDGSTGFNAVFDDQKFKGSHAGHICRVSFAPKQLRLGDDKKGIMNNEIYAMRKDPARKAEAEKLAAPHSSGAKISLEQKRWYSVSIEVMGDEMRVSLDGVPVAFLKSEGVAHETKSSFHFTVNGKGVLFDDVKISQAVN